MRRYQVVVSELAEKELDEIVYFIEETVSVASADRVANRIWRSVFALDLFPRRGTKFEPIPGVWIAPVKKYKYYLIYEIDDEKNIVVVHHIIHQHRNLGQLILK